PTAQAPGPATTSKASAVTVNQTSLTRINGILKEIDVPPLQIGGQAKPLLAESLSPFPADFFSSYQPDAAKTPLREAVLRARVVLWSLSPLEAPADLRAAVRQAKA